MILTPVIQYFGHKYLDNKIWNISFVYTAYTFVVDQFLTPDGSSKDQGFRDRIKICRQNGKASSALPQKHTLLTDTDRA